jgi:hypothetical protein
MPRSTSRRSVEVPAYLWEAIDQAAADQDMPTNALISMWLWQKLEEKRPDLHVRQPYRDGREMYSRPKKDTSITARANTEHSE